MYKKLNVILDLDQTLICSEELKKFDQKKHKQKMKNFKYEIFENLYIIFERPGLQAFLDYLFENFNVSVWTAASKDYALFIVAKFILTNSKRKLDFVFYSHHCDMSIKLKRGLKGLSIIWDVFGLKKYNAQNTVIVDDNPSVIKNQKCNVIPVHPFYFENRASYRDDEFTKIKDTLTAYKNLGKIPC